LFTEHSDAAGGIAITASHNPAPWNGLKFLDSGGVFLDADGNAALWHAVDTNATHVSSDQQSGIVEMIADTTTQHIERVLELPALQSVPRANGECVVVDAVNCSGSFVIPALLEALGYSVVRLYADGSGVFPHAPEPLTENLTELGNAVRQHNAVMGVAVDPDGDRLVLFDEHGQPIGEERTIALATAAALTLGAPGAVVVNYSTTRLVDDIAAEHGCTTYRAPVGEINVVRRMQRENAVIGGEGSGGVIYPACHAGRDSVVGVGLISAYLRHRACSLSQVCAEFPQYAMIKTKVVLDDRDRLAQDLARVASSVEGATISTDDGVHCAWGDRWVHVRGSNTEPIMRIIAEAPTQSDAEQLITMISALING
jgi:phosphomannomutase